MVNLAIPKRKKKAVFMVHDQEVKNSGLLIDGLRFNIFDVSKMFPLEITELTQTTPKNGLVKRISLTEK